MQKSSFNRAHQGNVAQIPKLKSKPHSLQVFIRVRPLLKSEFGKDTAITCNSKVF